MVCAVALEMLLPEMLPNDLVKDYYNVGISVLSIVFSVFFAALAVIITASDDEFVTFLEVTGDYSRLVGTFKFTLGLLFAALILSILLYVYTAARIAHKILEQNKLCCTVFSFLFFWSLLAAFLSSYDAIKYSEFRKRFAEAKQSRIKK